MYCGRCGKPNKDDSLFCEHCGAKLIVPKEPENNWSQRKNSQNQWEQTQNVYAQQRAQVQRNQGQVAQTQQRSQAQNAQAQQRAQAQRNQGQVNQNNWAQAQAVPKKSKFGAIKFIIIGLLIAVIIILLVAIISTVYEDNVYFSDDDSERYVSKDDDDESYGSGSSRSKYGTNERKNKKTSTDIEVDHYYRVDLPNAQAADDLIVKDSVEQKGTTSEEIKKIENQIIRDYKVKAVNLGEMDVETAKGVAKAFEYIYKNYPSARSMLSNISIGNLPASEGSVIAYFGPREFASSATSTSGYPMALKTLMCLNSRYFLDPDFLKVAMEQSSKAGHFPKNTNEYATVVHEAGHFLTLVATMKKYGLKSLNFLEEKDVDKYIKVVEDWNGSVEPLSIAKEAYENYKKKYNDNISFDEFRATISGYAMQKDDSGKYIYHETIAEAFHDYYVNGNNAAKASIEIVNVLNARLK